MNALVTWKEGLQLEAKANSPYTVTMDSAPAGVTPNAPSPMEFLLMALGGCTMMDVVSILQKMRKTIVSFTVELDAKRAEEHPKVFTSATLVYNLVSPDVTDIELRRAVDLSQEKYCSVSAMFKIGGAKLSVVLNLKRP
ncbi:MAG TPA: OsmC family protein [Candidatus Kapabacteria bacterium]|nr:OsmC family protein [Candidatus Kapabacteria bacterium]